MNYLLILLPPLYFCTADQLLEKVLRDFFLSVQNHPGHVLYHLRPRD